MFPLTTFVSERRAAVSQLACDGLADCWHLTDGDLEAALAEFKGQYVRTPDA